MNEKKWNLPIPVGLMIVGQVFILGAALAWGSEQPWRITRALAMSGSLLCALPMVYRYFTTWKDATQSQWGTALNVLGGAIGFFAAMKYAPAGLAVAAVMLWVGVIVYFIEHPSGK